MHGPQVIKYCVSDLHYYYHHVLKQKRPDFDKFFVTGWWLHRNFSQWELQCSQWRKILSKWRHVHFSTRSDSGLSGHDQNLMPNYCQLDSQSMKLIEVLCIWTWHLPWLANFIISEYFLRGHTKALLIKSNYTLVIRRASFMFSCL